MLKRFLRKVTPKPVLAGYHYTLAKAAGVRYRHPSEELVVIGVTGTNGKSSTVNFISQILTQLGETVGYTSTAGFTIAGKKFENRMKMTMPGRFVLQNMLREMVQQKCGYAIVETSSQGLEQHRHLGINYDLAVFTNLTPEHIEAHGSFTAYKEAKGKLFAHLTKMKHKNLHGKRIAKVSVLNADDEYADYFAQFPADQHVYYGWNRKEGFPGFYIELAKHESGQQGLVINGMACHLQLRATFEVQNALAAIATVVSLGFPLAQVIKAAEQIEPVPGRFEPIEAGQPFAVIVDYAYEPYALRALYASLAPFGYKRIIGVHGSAGGGRDVARRPQIGALAAEHEAVVIVTNEDPYDEDPRKIIEQVAEGAKEQGKTEGEDLFLIDDRAKAIAKAFSLAKKGDVVILTGKGSEPVMAVANGQTVAWDDRQAARKALAKLGYKT